MKSGHIAAVGLDVYEKESAYFFADSSTKVIADDNFARLLTFYNVFITYVLFSNYLARNKLKTLLASGHQAFLTEEALQSIAETTVKNLLDLQSSGTCDNLVNE